MNVEDYIYPWHRHTRIINPCLVCTEEREMIAYETWFGMLKALLFGRRFMTCIGLENHGFSWEGLERRSLRSWGFSPK